MISEESHEIPNCATIHLFDPDTPPDNIPEDVAEDLKESKRRGEMNIAIAVEGSGDNEHINNTAEFLVTEVIPAIKNHSSAAGECLGVVNQGGPYLIASLSMYKLNIRMMDTEGKEDKIKLASGLQMLFSALLSDLRDNHGIDPDELVNRTIEAGSDIGQMIRNGDLQVVVGESD